MGNKYGKISWQSTKDSAGAHTSHDVHIQVEAFLEACKKLIPHKILQKSCDVLVEESAQLHEVNRKIIEKIAGQPFLAAFIVWVKTTAALHPDRMHATQILLDHGFIGVTDKTGAIWTIADAHGFDHRVVLDAIRCRRELPLQLREQLVAHYLSFLHWLSGETQGYISKLEDPDLAKVTGKALPFPRFITFLTALKEKDQLVAKLLYYGGTPTLDEVVNVELKDINFSKKLVRYNSDL